LILGPIEGHLRTLTEWQKLELAVDQLDVLGTRFSDSFSRQWCIPITSIRFIRSIWLWRRTLITKLASPSGIKAGSNQALSSEERGPEDGRTGWRIPYSVY
jgi:hypothetical protein